MTDNSDYGTLLYELLRRADDGDAAPLDTYLAADRTRAASADHRHLLIVRHQFGTYSGGLWHAYSAQPDINPWPGSPTRTALVLVLSDARGGRSWHELTIPAGTRIEKIDIEGSTFRIWTNDGAITTTGDEVYRVIADCSFAPPGASEAEMARSFDKLAGRAPLEVVGPAEPNAPLGPALPLILSDPALGAFKFWPQRPARYIQTREDAPTYSLLTNAAGSPEEALARAREIIPDIAKQVLAGSHLVHALKPDFATSATRLLSAEFLADGSVRLSIDDGIEGSTSADLELGTDGKLNLLGTDGP